MDIKGIYFPVKSRGLVTQGEVENTQKEFSLCETNKK